MSEQRENPIYVTKPYLPPLSEYTKYLERIWDKGQLTNNGPLVQEFEGKLKEYLGVKHCYFVSNGTIALQLAIKALGLKGEIITTPFSFVATSSAIIWENCKPVFVDIDKESLNINPDLIEQSITKRTSAILATHVYGNPCNIEHIEMIAKKHNLKVIYDAAHSFGVNYKNKALVDYGDISTLSFHATKLFHSIEGGLVVTDDTELAHRISYMRNFGFKDQESFWGLGINAKNSEFHAAMGLCMLPYMADIIDKRKILSEKYDELIKSKLYIRRPLFQEGTEYNYSYYPILFETEKMLLDSLERLNSKDIYPRRYFHPPLNKLPYLTECKMEVAEHISKVILCLPLYDGLSMADVKEIVEEL